MDDDVVRCFSLVAVDSSLLPGTRIYYFTIYEICPHRGGGVRFASSASLEVRPKSYGADGRRLLAAAAANNRTADYNSIFYF